MGPDRLPPPLYTALGRGTCDMEQGGTGGMEQEGTGDME
jgi:hypothetical protein